MRLESGMENNNLLSIDFNNRHHWWGLKTKISACNKGFISLVE